MRIVVVGGTGRIGARLVRRLHERGHDVVAASRSSGFDVVTGAGVRAALAGADAVVDVSNPRAFEDVAAQEFFEAASRNLLAAEAVAGVGHHVALSVVGADRLSDSAYMRAKVSQEQSIRAAQRPYTVLRATQFFEFVDGIIGATAAPDGIHVPPAAAQPVAADDVVAALDHITAIAPRNETLEMAGPEVIRLDEWVRRYLVATQDPRRVITDARARYFGATLDDRSLIPRATARLGSTRLEDWLSVRFF